jgi:hypothetical protein
MKIKDGFVLEEVGGAYVAVAVGERVESFNGMVKLNSTGAFLWKKLKDNDLSREELVGEVVKAYDGVTEEEVLPGIVAFEEKLRAAGIIVE